MGNNCESAKGNHQFRSNRAIQDEFQQELEDGPYIAKMRREMFDVLGFPKGATKVLDFLYLGGENEACKPSVLKEIGITHVINCAQGYIQTGPDFYGKDVRYMGFDAEDDDNYNIMQHFTDVYKIIEQARTSGGKVFIHCIMGVNRSGALAVAYCMVHKNMGPIAAARFVKKARRILLSNDTFQRQLITFARQRNLLHHDDAEVKG